MLPTILGLYSGFQAETWIAKWSEHLGVPLGMLFAVCWGWTHSEILVGGWLKRFFMGAALFGVLTAFAWGGIRSGLPWLYTFLHSDLDTLQVVVLSKGDGKFRWRDRCERFQLRLVQFETKQSWTICLGEEAWKAFAVGQKVTVVRRTSAMGSYVVSVEKVN